MKNGIRLALVAAFTLAVTACAPGARLGGGKEGAAEALFQASSPATGARGAALQAIRSGAFTGSIKVDGRKSGTATLTADVLASVKQGEVAYAVKYDNYSDDGKVFYNGTLTMGVGFKFDVSDDAASGDVQISFKGRVRMSGEIDDFLEADVTETLSFSAIAASGASVTLKLDGTIQTATETHTYANETLSFTADWELPKVEASASRS